MEHVAGHHTGQLSVLVRLRAVEVVTVHHGDRLLAAELQPNEFFEVGDWVDSPATNSIVVSSYGPQHANASVLGAFHHGHDLRSEQEMAEVVDLMLLLMAILRPFRVVEGGLIDGSVARKSVDGTIASEFVQLFDEPMHRGEAGKLEVHGSEVIHVKAFLLRHHFHLVHVANGADDVVFLCSQQRLGCRQSEARRGPSNDYELLVSELRARDTLKQAVERWGLDIRHPCVALHLLYQEKEAN
mmetsp:Transcript_105369/g.275110  ORF Transcript_105369/g.275110 Transcript_105369/m.275110 type:complete len:242 (+) Transcript_105369:1853-2578(+)